MAENEAPERIWIGGEQHQLISANRRGGGNYYHERASYRSHTDIAYVREHANLAAPDVAQTVYGLMAIGDSRNGWQFKMQSKKLFVRRADAEAFIPDFKLLCCDGKQVESAKPETLNITVTERVLVGAADAVRQAQRETEKQ